MLMCYLAAETWPPKLKLKEVKWFLLWFYLTKHPSLFHKITISPFFFSLSPSFSFPHPINPVAYQQLLSQQRGLNAFGHTPPLIQPSPSSFSARQHPLTTSPMTASHNSSNSEVNQVGNGAFSTHYFLLFFTHPHLRVTFLLGSCIMTLYHVAVRKRVQASGLTLTLHS